MELHHQAEAAVKIAAVIVRRRLSSEKMQGLTSKRIQGARAGGSFSIFLPRHGHPGFGSSRMATNALNIALDVIARRIAPVPVPVGKKGPTIRDWQHLEITAENASQYFNGQALNVGAIMGPRSRGLTDVDLDCREAIALAPYFL